MVTVETISIVFTGLSISLAAFYYISTLRNAEKTRQREQIYLRFQSFDLPYMRSVEDVMNQEWKGTFEDWQNHSHESRANYNFLTTRYQNVGIMLKENMMDPDLLFQIFNPQFIMNLWEKTENNIRGSREDDNNSTYMAAFEYLYNETKKRYPDIITKRGQAAK